MGSTVTQMNMEVCWMHEGQFQMHQPLQIMLVQYSFLGRNHCYSMNQNNLAFKDNPKEKILGGTCLIK